MTPTAAELVRREAARTADRHADRPFVRTAIALALSRGAGEAAEIARRRWGGADEGVVRALEKAASGASTTDNSDGILAPAAGHFLASVQPRTVLGRLDKLRRVPVYEGAALATGGGVWSWVGEGAPVPVGRFTWTQASLDARKAGGIVVFTDTLLRSSSQAAEGVAREELAAGLATLQDATFLSSDAAVAGVSPAGIMNGITAVASTGDPVEDLHELLGGFDSLEDVAVVASGANAVAFANANIFADGLLFGFIPLVISSAAGTNLVAIHQPSVLYADEGGIRIDSARHATIQMDTEPTNDSGTPTATELVSLWQSNSTALKVIRTLNWQRADDDAVAVISGTDYGAV